MPEARGSGGVPGLAATLALCAAVIGLPGTPARAGDDSPGFGRPASDAEIADAATHVFADGRGLPPGSGDAVRGKALYDAQCAGCHGDAGQGGSALELVGDRALLATEFPDRGIGVYWPYAPPLFEYLQRAMPPDKPGSLGDDEVYSVIAHLLVLNDLIEPGVRVDAALLAGLPMPNRDNFRSGHADIDPVPATGEQ